MKISKRGEYALRALIDLGIASELGWPMLQISELASKEKLPIKFLEQIFTQLKAGGYVSSRRGKFGGYSLARPMSQIKYAISTILDRYTLADIVEITLRKYRRDKVAPPFLHRSIPFTSALPQKKEALRSKRRAAARNRFSGSPGSGTNNHPPKRR